MSAGMSNKELGHTLALLRIAKGFSVEDVKNRTGLFVDQIQEIENGKNVSSETVNRILELYGLELQNSSSDKIDRRYNRRIVFTSILQKLFNRNRKEKRNTNKAEAEAENALQSVIESVEVNENGKLVVKDGEISEQLQKDYGALMDFKPIVITSIPSSTQEAEKTKEKWRVLKSFDTSQHKWEFYTDGSCIMKSGKGAWAFILLCDGIPVVKKSGFQKQQTTSTIMEYTAIAYALKTAVDLKIKEVNLYTDCKPIAEIISNETCYNSKNMTLCDLVTTIKNNKDMFNIFNIGWVPGHDENKWNVIADKLANQELACRKLVRN